MWIHIDGKRKGYTPLCFCKLSKKKSCKVRNNLREASEDGSNFICHLCKYFKAIDIPEEFK